jgi:hypothetical protein
LVSKKRPCIRLLPVELEVRRETSAEGAQAVQQLTPSGLARNAERRAAGDVDFHVVTFLQAQRLDDGGGNPDCETVAPFGNLHGETPQIYTIERVYLR